MKKTVAVLLALFMLVSLAACNCGNGGGGGNQSNTSSNASGQNDSGSGNNSEENTSSNPAEPEAAKLTAKMNIINLDDRDPSVLRGVAVKGNRAGKFDGINGKEFSLTDVRCIFELNEWVEFFPDTDATYGVKVWILKHRDDQEYYNTCKFSDLMPNFANYCDLHYPEDEDNPDEYPWGSFYLNSKECEPGYYDFVFTYEGKAIATLLTRFYGENEIAPKTDAELEALMHE